MRGGNGGCRQKTPTSWEPEGHLPRDEAAVLEGPRVQNRERLHEARSGEGRGGRWAFFLRLREGPAGTQPSGKGGATWVPLIPPVRVGAWKRVGGSQLARRGLGASGRLTQVAGMGGLPRTLRA